MDTAETHDKMRPQTQTKIAFMHIPKTAGISVIDVFRTRLGPDQCVAFSNAEISEESFRGKRFVSGHVYLGDIRGDAFIFTFLREPLKQIASHLLWVDHYNMPEYKDEASHLHHTIKSAIARLAEAEFSDAGSLARYLDWLPKDSDLRMTNVQCEHLAFRRDHVVPMADHELAAAAINNLDRIAFTGIAEHLDADVAALFELLKLGDAPTVQHLNQSPAARKIDLSDPSISRVLARYVEADRRLYDHVVSRRNERLRNLSG